MCIIMFFSMRHTRAHVMWHSVLGARGALIWSSAIMRKRSAREINQARMRNGRHRGFFVLEEPSRTHARNTRDTIFNVNRSFDRWSLCVAFAAWIKELNRVYGRHLEVKKLVWLCILPGRLLVNAWPRDCSTFLDENCCNVMNGLHHEY